MARSGINAHLTPTKKKRNIRSEQTTNYANQGYCSECGKKTIWNCSQFLDDKDDPDAKDIWMCHTETGRNCFDDHMKVCHTLYIITYISFNYQILIFIIL